VLEGNQCFGVAYFPRPDHFPDFIHAQFQNIDKFIIIARFWIGKFFKAGSGIKMDIFIRKAR